MGVVNKRAGLYLMCLKMWFITVLLLMHRSVLVLLLQIYHCIIHQAT